MIDTVKFRIPIDEKGYEVLLQNSNVHTGFDYKTKNRQYLIIKTPISIGSYSRDRVLRIPREYIVGSDSNYAELELSIPKYEYGHNVRMIQVSDFNKICENIAKDLSDTLGITTDVKYWEIQRIDFCYSWKLQNEQQLHKYLKMFQALDYSRKKKYTYDTSAMYKGTAFTLKIYSKYEEYLAHDYKALFKEYDDYAEGVLETRTECIKI